MNLDRLGRQRACGLDILVRSTRSIPRSLCTGSLHPRPGKRSVFAIRRARMRTRLAWTCVRTPSSFSSTRCVSEGLGTVAVRHVAKRAPRRVPHRRLRVDTRRGEGRLRRPAVAPRECGTPGHRARGRRANLGFLRSCATCAACLSVRTRSPDPIAASSWTTWRVAAIRSRKSTSSLCAARCSSPFYRGPPPGVQLETDERGTLQDRCEDPGRGTDVTRWAHVSRLSAVAAESSRTPRSSGRRRAATSR